METNSHQLWRIQAKHCCLPRREKFMVFFV